MRSLCRKRRNKSHTLFACKLSFSTRTFQFGFGSRFKRKIWFALIWFNSRLLILLPAFSSYQPPRHSSLTNNVSKQALFNSHNSRDLIWSDLIRFDLAASIWFRAFNATSLNLLTYLEPKSFPHNETICLKNNRSFKSFLSLKAGCFGSSSLLSNVYFIWMSLLRPKQPDTKREEDDWSLKTVQNKHYTLAF